MPIILMEAMIAGLPIASSNYGPMPEILHDGGIYFDPEDVQSILTAIQILIVNPKLREDISNKSSKLVSHFNWKKCANETFNFFEKILIR
jgi:glycosyltransferase involved in cell wall biosynthesis